MQAKENRGKLFQIIASDFELTRGQPFPLGATVKRGGINFAVFSRHATLITLVIFQPGETEPIVEFPLDPRYNRTGDIWHTFIRGLDHGVEYGYRADRQPACDGNNHRFNYDTILIDPYSKSLSGGSQWGKRFTEKNKKSASQNKWHSLIVEDAFDWGFDQPLNIHLADSIIYEIHVRGFTRHPSSRVARPGTFAGIVEKIPYLKELGITAVELLPVIEFDENDNPRFNPETQQPLLNFWGYHPVCFFSPKASYASNQEVGSQIVEFKSMVKSLHEAGIEVILDMVFNHTAEGDERQEATSFRGLDNSVYYIIDHDTGEYLNFSGCGNTLNCNHPVVRDLILDCLCYWVTEMHVDGFRFDLASILGRGQDGSVLANPPLLERIAANPVLANTKLIAEAWDAAGLYQVGTFPNWGRWAEWNGKFRDDIRRFIRGDANMLPALATRLTGSADLYQESDREPFHSVNFITSHDGFTLNDLVSYNEKHNIANGENERDGENENLSWNCGQEGPSISDEVKTLRNRQIKNMATILMLSQGVPMILGGDEMGRTQQGNNNAYCHDNEINWVNWELLDQNKELFRFFQLLIRFRKKHPIFRLRSFITEDSDNAPNISWHGLRLNQPDWSPESRSLGMHWSGGFCKDDIFIIANAHWEKQRFELPILNENKKWHRFVDTSMDASFDIAVPDKGPLIDEQRFYDVQDRSVVVLMSKSIKDD